MGQAAPGARIGPFELERRLGAGGVGVVWRARHVDVGTTVAVKLLNPRWIGRPGVLEGFAHEVRSVASLVHPRIALLLDHGRVELDGAEVPWLATELVKGGSLHDQPPPTAWPDVRAALLDLLDALAYAHARGVIHRDVKPGNALVARDGVKLTDFGLAHHVGRRGGEAMVGTPSFMAPEQIDPEDDPVGPWTDLYGLACLAWTLLTGRPPFVGSGRLEVMAAHLKAPPPPFTPRFSVPPGVEDWLRWLLAKAPHDRPLLAADAAHALESLSNTPRASIREPPAAPASWRVPAPALPHQDLIRASTSAFWVRHTPLVGRESERDRLWEALSQVIRRRRPLVVTLEGALGTGKSRLAQWLRERACEQGVAVPLLLEPDDDLSAALHPYRPVLASAHPEEALAELCQRRPVVLQVDDAERAAPALQLVVRLRDVPELPLLVVLTTQSDDPADPAAARALAALPHRRIRVDPLPPNRLRELASDLLLVRGPVVDAIVERAGGSPRFVVELLRDWVAREELVWSGDGYEPRESARIELPPSVRAVWEQRIERALADRPADAIAVELGGLLGRAPIREWEEACRAAGVAPSLDLLDHLARLGLARLSGSPPRSWAPAHGLVREALAARSRAHGRLAILHQHCATGLLRVAPSDRPPALAARIGHHLLQAGRPADAVDFLLEAVAHADATSEHRLRDLLTALEQAHIPEHDVRWGRAWNAAADVAAVVGGHLDDIDWTVYTVAVALAHGWLPELAGALARQAQRLCRFGEAELAVETAARAFHLSSHLEPSVQLDVQSRVVRVAASTGRYEQAIPLLERLAVRHAALGHRREAGSLALELARVLKARGSLNDAGRWVDQARTWLEAAGSRSGVASCDALIADLARERGDLEAADRAWESARRRRHPGVDPEAAREDLGRALTRIQAGDTAGARQIAEAALVSARQDRQPSLVCLARLVIAHDELAGGDPAQAAQLLDAVECELRDLHPLDEQVAHATASLATLAADHDAPDLRDRAQALAQLQYDALGRRTPL